MRTVEDLSGPFHNFGLLSSDTPQTHIKPPEKVLGCVLLYTGSLQQV